MARVRNSYCSRQLATDKRRGGLLDEVGRKLVRPFFQRSERAHFPAFLIMVFRVLTQPSSERPMTTSALGARTWEP